MTFSEVLPTLNAGEPIRRDTWDAKTQMRVDERGDLVQQATGAPYRYSLDGYEITAKDWQTVNTTV